MEESQVVIRQWLTEALAHQRAGRFSAALLAYRRVVSRDPEVVDAWCNLSSVLRELGRPEEAREACSRALALDPDHLLAQCNLASLKGDAGDFEGALAILEALKERHPEHFLVHFQSSWILFSLGRIEEALESDERAVALEPSVAAAHLNRGYTLMKLGRLAEAEAAMLHSLELDPDQALGHWNLAFLRLLDGRFAEAWPHYAWRWKLRESLPSVRQFAQPAWQGEPLEGRSLLVWAEQGFGDTIQFSRYVPLLRQRGARVILQVQPALVTLMRTCAGAEWVLSERETPPPFDLHVPILDLPQIFGTTPEDLPGVIPYLACPAGPPRPALEQALRGDGRTRIGLAWHGNPNQKDNRTRSLDPAVLEPLAALPGITWFQLQKYAPGVVATPLPGAFQACDLSPHLETFADTAYAIEHLDLVISVDTAVAHLAGALGRPAIVLLPFCPDWRWLIKGDTCPWYSTLQLYRQPRPGDWPSVIQALLHDFA